ncbi:SpoIIE family protein phosphatase [Sediminibacterium sp.]|uniref:SpoIIE family protein phosphatase n=1 Tax=Sediminibacterium sp. TaxID=1917865 RepID=UPI002735110C|nr:SpoIIE family protein phosphatase [Sediminibacterium sp.]MDP3567537.1 tetratricopeptide repeat protein [Sediminibacterium sp.]
MKQQFLLLFILTSNLSFSQTESYLDSIFKVCNELKKQNTDIFIEKSHYLYSQTKKAKNEKYKQKTENLFGIYFTNNQKFDSGFVYFSKALVSAENNKDTLAIAKALMNIGIVLRYQKNFLKAEKYFNDAYLLCKTLNDNSVQISVLYNLSGLFLDWGKFNEAISVNRNSLALSTRINDIKNQIKALEALGSNFSELKQLDSAKKYLLIAYEKANAIDYDEEKIYLCNNIGVLYLQEKDYASAEKYLIEAESQALKQNAKNALIDIYANLKDLYYKTNQLKNCISYFHLQDSIKTLIYNQDLINTTAEIETKYQTEKKDLQLKQTNSELIFQAEKNKQKTIIIWIGALAFICTLFFLILAFVNYKRAKKANLIVQNQNQILELQKKEVQHQKSIIEEKQHEIISSINYAQRIQSAVLTGEEVWNKISKEHFIFFQPRDIVSGDFYWAHVLSNGRAVFALADCTGHGVPGGFMSMLGNSFLNELVVENKLFKADEILNRLRDKVIAALFQKGETQQKDGMDMALCVWNKMDNTLEFAGANNILYLVRDKQLLEYKGDKMPIGAYLEENKKFSAQKITVQTNDFIYLTTDGFADQFGGEKGKKFKSKQLEQLLVEVSSLPSEEQKERLTKAFLNWKLKQEQTDDVSVIGIKVT